MIQDESKIPNPFDKSIRTNCKFQFTDFSKEQSEINAYGPSKLQKQQFEATDIKLHLIHTKLKSQSAKAVKKMAGVSYVKATESHQLNIDYEPLAHTCFQGSYNVEAAEKPYHVLENLWQQRLAFIYFESPTEKMMKNYILNP